MNLLFKITNKYITIIDYLIIILNYGRDLFRNNGVVFNLKVLTTIEK